MTRPPRPPPVAGRTPPQVRDAGRERGQPGRAGRPGVGLPGLPAAGRLAGAGGPGQAAGACAPSRTGAGRSPAGATTTPRILIVGLAPAAHGGNRTGRVFTGDRSGDLLFASLYRCGLAAAAGQHGGRATASGCCTARMVAAVRCAPPANKPTMTERDTCAPVAGRRAGLPGRRLRVIVCLGGFAWQALWPALPACRVRGAPAPAARSATGPRPRWPEPVGGPVSV